MSIVLLEMSSVLGPGTAVAGPLERQVGLEQRFQAPLDSIEHLERRFGGPLDVKLVLEWRLVSLKA